MLPNQKINVIRHDLIVRVSRVSDMVFWCLYGFGFISVKPCQYEVKYFGFLTNYAKHSVRELSAL